MKSLGTIILAAMAALAVLLISPSWSPACTNFVIASDGSQVYGRNFDFETGDGLVMVNKRGVSKTSFIMKGLECRPVHWVSKYGSITFNLFGREFPMGGMNQAGLVIVGAGLWDAGYPELKDRGCFALSVQMVQYVLDTCADSAEVVAAFEKVGIRPMPKADYPGAHYLVADRQGRTTIIEFIAGKMKVYTGGDLPVAVLTNSPYPGSLGHLKNDTTPDFDFFNSIRRFKAAAKMIAAYDPKTHGGAVEYAFKVLAAAGIPPTQWSIVYDNRAMRIYFRNKGHSDIREIDFKAFDFSCDAPVMVLATKDALKGDVTKRFTPYTTEANHELIRRAFGRTSFLMNTPAITLRRMAEFPVGQKCVPQPKLRRWNKP